MGPYQIYDLCISMAGYPHVQENLKNNKIIFQA